MSESNSNEHTGDDGLEVLEVIAPTGVENVLAWGLRPESEVFGVFFCTGDAGNQHPAPGSVETFWTAQARCEAAARVCPDALLSIHARVGRGPDDHVEVARVGNAACEAGGACRFGVGFVPPGRPTYAVVQVTSSGRLEAVLARLACLRALFPRVSWNVGDYQDGGKVAVPRDGRLA
jgi:hypothetical protein